MPCWDDACVNVIVGVVILRVLGTVSYIGRDLWPFMRLHWSEMTNGAEGEIRRYTGTCRRRVLLAGIGLCAAVVLSGCSAPGALPGGSQSEAEMLPLDDPLVEDQLGEELALPPVGLETMEWLDRLPGELTGDPNFGSPAISDDRSTVTLTWFGTPSARLGKLVAQAPEDLTVVIQSALFRPAELNALTQRAVTTKGLVPGVQVAMGSPAADASGITIGIVELPAGRSLEQLGTAFAQALERPDVPIEVEVSGTFMPING